MCPFYFLKIYGPTNLYHYPRNPRWILLSYDHGQTIMTEYTITKSRFGLYTSIKADGTRMVTGETEDGVRWITDNIHLPVEDGTYDGWTSTPRTATVEGKL